MFRTAASGLSAAALAGLSVVVLAGPASAAQPPCHVNRGGHYPPGLCRNASVTSNTQTPRAGGTITLSYTGLRPGTTVNITLDSNGVSLGSFTVGAGGNLSVSVRIPSGYAGAHTIIATGTSTSGSAIDFSLPITIRSAQQTGGLPFTGSNTAVEGAAGIGLVAAGAAVVVLGRRRRQDA